MHFILLSLFWLLVFFSMMYVLVIVTFTIGWLSTRGFKTSSALILPDVSVVIAVRNEQKNIMRLLNDLRQQDFPLNQLEILIINDHSDDATVLLIDEFMTENKNIDVRLIHSKGEGKKFALREGIQMSKHDLIVTTDGDCSMGSAWLRRLAEFFIEKKPKLIVGPVVYEKRKGFSQHFYWLDFMSLVASGAGSLGAGLPLMANGASLAFEKQAFLDVVKSQSGKSFASGDDVFLLHAVADRYGAKSIHFLKDPSTIVHTNPPENLVAFLSQRKRWASKATDYRSWWAVMVSIIVFVLNFMLVLGFFMAFYKPLFLIIFGLFILLKILIDFPLMHYFAEFVNRKKSVPYLFLFGFIYPFYVVFTATSSFFFRYKWKGRNSLR